MNTIPTVTKNILIINVLMFLGTIVAQSYGIDLDKYLGLHFFLAGDFNAAQLITYMFMHAGFAHIFFNMFAVWMFGRILEQVWGPRRFLFYYLACGIGAGLVQEVVQYIHYETVLSAYDSVNTGLSIIPMKEYLNMMTTVGASGAVYAILLAFGMLFPNQQMFIFPLPFPIKAKYFVIGYALIELYAGFANNAGDNVAHFAHPPEKTDDGKITIGGLDANVWMTKYGNVYTDCKAKDFMGKLGFSWGDLVTVKFLDKTLTLPVVPTYSYVDSGKPAIIVEKDADGKPTGYVSMAINMGNFAETYELAKKHTNEDKTWYWTAWEGVTYPVEVTFKMAEKGGYMAEYIMHDLQRTNDRADYPDLSDAEFGNFRNIATTGMGKDVLYRGSSPINPELGRNTYVDAALKQAGVNVIMNLANSQEEAEAYEGFADTYYSGQKVIYLNLGVDFSAPEFQKGLAEGLRFFAANKGTYYVHCTEGKDRAGFVSALLECLMGATYDEVVADYMVTYYNYYGVEPGTDKYDAIANSNIIKTLQNAFGVEDLSKADLQKGAKDYMKAIGLTDAEITDLMVNLGYVAPVEPVTPSKPATGDAGIVVYLGLGVMALAGGVLVAKKKEQF